MSFTMTREKLKEAEGRVYLGVRVKRTGKALFSITESILMLQGFWSEDSGYSPEAWVPARRVARK